ncbi:MAG TPA: aminoglycoside phosphotransferase family protein [Puia sp.]|jgi:thiamine kinase-like enzyme|nr:aminoglycoside phosphotransferase family protein [Puia sp.]
MFGSILSLYGIDESEYSVKPFGNGLINHTWKIISAGKEFLLQKINQKIFKRPVDIMENCSQLSDYFRTNNPDYLFVTPLINFKHRNYVVDEENNYFRLFPFVKNSYTCNSVSKPGQAYEAAKQFGKFTSLLSRFNASKLHITVPDFHNLTLRLDQFKVSIQTGNRNRIEETGEAIDFLLKQDALAGTFEKIKKNPSFTLRVVHHDAKINNVLFDIGNDVGLCVIDLDTVMPGYYISDVGDMLRTYLSPVSEEEPDFSRIVIREEYFREIAKGYLGEMQLSLSPEEKQYFIYAGKFAIYMQALRFLTDYLCDDIYYSTKYRNQNLIRANNQITLLQRYLEKENRLNEILNS